jgi:hypothetical protein
MDPAGVARAPCTIRARPPSVDGLVNGDSATSERGTARWIDTVMITA